MRALAELRAPVDAFFDKVTVNARRSRRCAPTASRCSRRSAPPPSTSPTSPRSRGEHRNARITSHVHKDEDSAVGVVPDLPGCFSAGDTYARRSPMLMSLCASTPRLCACRTAPAEARGFERSWPGRCACAARSAHGRSKPRTHRPPPSVAPKAATSAQGEWRPPASGRAGATCIIRAKVRGRTPRHHRGVFCATLCARGLTPSVARQHLGGSPCASWSSRMTAISIASWSRR